MSPLRNALLMAWALLLAACAPFPQVEPGNEPPPGPTAQVIFDRMLAEHGGNLHTYPGDINLASDGEWYPLILRIQPEVTDAGFRIASEERYRPSVGLYAVRYTGPQGVKHTVSSAAGLSLTYNAVPETDPVKRRATALTHDTFRMFHFGPSYFLDRTAAMVRLTDAVEDGQRYHRLLLTLRPGFGESPEDQAVLWIHPQTFRWFRVHQTLNGFERTQGAHVDTTFLAYQRVGQFLFPVKFIERVRGPLQIDAHRWRVTGIDLDRGWSAGDVTGDSFTGSAETPATPLPPGN
jgi:hypothetical protein